MNEIKQFVIDRYNEAQKTIHVDYEKVIVLSVMLSNGYVIVEHCICMDPKEFDLNKGLQLCQDKAFNKLLEIYQPVKVKNPEKIKKFSLKAK